MLVKAAKLVVDIVVNSVVDIAANCEVCNCWIFVVVNDDKLSADKALICVDVKARKFVELRLLRTDAPIA